MTTISREQTKAFQLFRLDKSQIRDVVVDSALSNNDAIGNNSIIPADCRKRHGLIKPYLTTLHLVHHSYDGKVHLGQMVVHQYIEQKVVRLFLAMWQSGFPVYSVIPQSQFGYNDEQSMAANNSSGYRPENNSEHGKGSAFDINPYTNPFDATGYDPKRTIQPAGARYNPNAKGAIVLGGPVQKLAAKLNLEWGGNWGNPNAVPLSDFFVGHKGFFDWQHFQLSDNEYAILESLLPSGFSS